jgi:hypothetical protein
LFRRGNNEHQSPEVTRDTILPTIRASFSERIVGDATKVISIRLGDAKAETSAQLPVSVDVHPRFSLLAQQHQLEGLFNPENFSNPAVKQTYKQNLLAPLMYDRNVWAKYDAIDISVLAKSFLNDHKMTSDSNAYEVLAIIRKVWTNTAEVVAINHAANIYSYLYLVAGRNNNHQGFVQHSFQLFKAPFFNTSKGDKECMKYLKKYGATTNRDEVGKLAQEIYGVAAKLPASPLRTCLGQFLDQLAVIQEACFILFTKFSIPVRPAVMNDREKSKVADAKQQAAAATPALVAAHPATAFSPIYTGTPNPTPAAAPVAAPTPALPEHHI